MVDTRLALHPTVLHALSLSPTYVSLKTALDGSGGHLGQLQEVRFLLCGPSCPSLIALPINGADSGGRSFLRQKTQARGRSNRAIAARPMICSALGGEPRGDRVTVIAGHVAHVQLHCLLLLLLGPIQEKRFH